MTPLLKIEGASIHPFGPADEPVLQRLFDEDPEYFEVNGRTFPVAEIVTALPPGSARDDKFVFVMTRDGRIDGMIDVIRGYPEPSTWFLGFLFVAKHARGKGLGRHALHGLYRWVADQGGRVLRLGVVEGNEVARALYDSEGFELKAVREIDPSVKRMRRTFALERALEI